MHPQAEQLALLLEEAKNGNASSLEKFYGRLWMAGIFIPASEVRALCESAYEFLKPLELQQPKNFATATLGLGFGCFHSARFEEALKWQMEAQRLFRELQDEDGVQGCNVLIAASYRSIGEIELSVKYNLEAHRHLSQTGAFKVFQIFCTYTLAETYSETNQLDDALRYYLLAIPLAQDYGNEFMVARGYEGIAVVYQRQKKYAQALEYYNKALKLCEHANGLSVKARIITDMGVYYFEMGDYETAISYQQQALTIREELKIANAPITNLIHLGEIYQKQGKFDQALEVLHRGLLIAEELKVKIKTYQVHKLLSDLYLSKGDSAKCFFHHKAYHDIKEEVQHEDNERKIKNLHLVFEAEQTQKENAIIKAQKKEIEKKNVQLQRTVDELTRTRVSRKAKAITLVIAVLLFLLEEIVLHFTESIYMHNSFVLSLSIKGVILISLKPIENFIESFLLKKIMREKVEV